MSPLRKATSRTRLVIAILAALLAVAEVAGGHRLENPRAGGDPTSQAWFR